MEQSATDHVKLPEKQDSGFWQRLRQGLGFGAIGGATEPEGNGTTSGENGDGAGHLPVSNGKEPLDTEEVQLRPMVETAVNEAIKQHEEDTKWRAGKKHGRTVPALVLGPQRYRDPAIWSPDPRLRAPVDSEERKDARENPLDLNRDRHYQKVLEFLDDLDADSGFNRNP